jgi:hypothetical protein
MLSLAILATGCAHEERPYAFAVQAPTDAVLASAQAALQRDGQTVIVKSPTRLVTPWQVIGNESAIISTEGGELEPVVDRQRFAVLVQPDGAATKVMVREDHETCPIDMPSDRSRTPLAACVRTSEVTGGDQQKIDQLGRELQAVMASSSR